MSSVAVEDVLKGGSTYPDAYAEIPHHRNADISPPCALTLSEASALDRDLGSPFSFTRLAEPADAAGALSNFLVAASAGQEPLGNAILALRDLLVALPQGVLSASGAAALLRLEHAFRAAAPIVAEHADIHLAAEAVHLGMAAAVRLTGFVAAPLDDDGAAPALVRAYIDHIALLADELDAVVRRRRIEAGGDQFRRRLQIEYASRAVDDGRPLS